METNTKRIPRRRQSYQIMQQILPQIKFQFRLNRTYVVIINNAHIRRVAFSFIANKLRFFAMYSLASSLDALHIFMRTNGTRTSFTLRVLCSASVAVRNVLC